MVEELAKDYASYCTKSAIADHVCTVYGKTFYKLCNLILIGFTASGTDS